MSDYLIDDEHQRARLAETMVQHIAEKVELLGDLCGVEPLQEVSAHLSSELAEARHRQDVHELFVEELENC